MEYDEIAPGIRAIFPERNGVNVLSSNVYLLEDAAAGTLMIDSGIGRLPFEKPALCILTHGHFDHTRGVRGDWRALMHPADFGLAFPFWQPPKAEKLDMKPMKWGRFELEFMHTPGHSPGSICMLERRSGVLFSGDTIFADGGVGRTDLLGSSPEQMEKSLELLKKVDYKVLCPGHGRIE